MSGASDREANDLIGRDTALTEMGRLLRTERLVTVSGPGGVGKTALVTEPARGMRPGRWEAVGRADPARLHDAKLPADRLATALLGDTSGGRPPSRRRPERWAIRGHCSSWTPVSTSPRPAPSP
ncbi:hypothetical protein [Streptomyces sp. NPDC042319]|uniref:hypothetical protein n=1 Tax=Streptomyces sp. NPDC042319 TaxID=3154332 RepID=UPI0033EA993D